jgi:hypothetical protein
MLHLVSIMKRNKAKFQFGVEDKYYEKEQGKVPA